MSSHASIPLAFAASIVLHLGVATCMSVYYLAGTAAATAKSGNTLRLHASLRPLALAKAPSPDTEPVSAQIENAATHPAAPDVAPTPAQAPDTARPHYRPPGELTRRPRLIVDVEPLFPADDGGPLQGGVVLRVMVNERGLVDDVQIESSDLPAPFQDAAREAFLRAAYHPGEREGMPVKSQVRVEVRYVARFDRIPWPAGLAADATLRRGSSAEGN